MKKTIDANFPGALDGAIDVAREAMAAAKAGDGNWADAVDRALSGAAYRTLDAVEYGAERNPNLIAVIDDHGAAGIWRHDDGTWTAGPIEHPLMAAREAIEAAGYDISRSSEDDRLYIAVIDMGEDDPEVEAALDEIRRLVRPLGCKADWTGNGGTDAYGVSTSDIAVMVDR